MQPPNLERTPSERLQFRPRWWWDPVPIWLIDELDKSARLQLAEIQLRVEIEALKSQLEATQQVAEVLAKQR
jgi:hypothetical protein